MLEALEKQRYWDPDAIFGPCPPTIDVEEVFRDMPPPGKYDMRGRVRRDYRRRGSSGRWEADALTAAECEAYRAAVKEMNDKGGLGKEY